MSIGTRRKDGDALDVLERQDRALMTLFADLDSSRGRPGVLERYEHGNQSKRLIRRIAYREAAKADLLSVLADDRRFDAVREHLIGAAEERRNAMNVLDLMSRGVRPIDLNKTQDLDGAIDDLRRVAAPEIRWELEEGIATVRDLLSSEQRARLHSAHYVRRHAPTKLDPEGLRQPDHFRFVTWALTVWDHLLDRPRPVRGSQVR